MLDTHAPRALTRKTLAGGLVSAGLVALLAAPAGATVNIPEGGAVPPDSSFVINFQVRDGCDGAAVDGLEVTIPENVENPLPESVPGWETEVTTMDEDGDERTVVRWTGGSIEPGEFMEFGLRARFPDEPDATLAFPAVQTCGEEQVEFSADEAPTVTLATRIGPRDLIDLQGAVEQLRTDLDDLDTRLSGVDPENLRSRVRELEDTVEELAEQLEAAVELVQEPVNTTDEGDGS